MKYFRLPSIGAMVEITPEGYDRAMRVAVASTYHDQLCLPGHGFVHDGDAYFVLEER